MAAAGELGHAPLKRHRPGYANCVQVASLALGEIQPVAVKVTTPERFSTRVVGACCRATGARHDIYSIHEEVRRSRGHVELSYFSRFFSS
jgi:hypothetical protein